MYRVGIKRPFKASHFLAGDFEDESRPHEHTYTADWIMEVDGLDENGFSVDIALMEELLEEVTTSVEGVLLNDLPFFENRQSSVENTAEYLSRELFEKLAERGASLERLRRSEMRIWENDSAWASYATEDPSHRNRPK